VIRRGNRSWGREQRTSGAALRAITRMARLDASLLIVVFLVSMAMPLSLDAQQPQRLYRIGVLERTSATINAPNLDAFRQGLRELGYVEGTNFTIEYRSADGRDERHSALAAELMQHKVDLIVTRGTPATLAAMNATRTTPVVMTGVGDPVGQGLVASLAHPGGNEQPTKFELLVNTKTAERLGLTIPQSLLVRADRVIQ
jgi:ABC-type uncharacterized transport system substrate-binding protein